MGFARSLYEDNAPTFRAALSHPFVLGIGDGSLPREVFSRWIVQDWLYLQGYIDALEKACLLAPDTSTGLLWWKLRNLTLDEELALHQGLARKFDSGPEDLDTAEPYQATKHYLTVLKTASLDYPTLIATLTPCAVGYAKIARELHAQDTCAEPDYVDWILTYMDPAFQETVQLFEAELDRLGQCETMREIIREGYARAVQCELDFWNGLWQGY